MTREEAINKLIRIRQLQGGKSEAHEALGMAIDALAYQAELPEGLEKAAMSYYLADIQHPGHYDESGKPYPKAINDAFIAGAEWQRKQDQSLIELAEDHAMLAGMNKMKEEMMKAAVDGRYMKADGKVYVESWLLDIDSDSVKAGDEVRLIVIPEENLNTVQNEN